MNQFKFNGDWKFEINLEEFIKSNSTWKDGAGRNNNVITLSIMDSWTYDPDPLKEQLTTVNFIINNEGEAIQSISKAFEIINKAYGGYCGEHDWYPSVMSKENLGSVFLIRELLILTEHMDGHAYYQLTGEYEGDLEHGLIVVMHRDRLIAFNQIGEDGYKEIYEDLGERGKAFTATNIENRANGENQIHQLLDKYGKHKPWQLNATAEYFQKLIRERKNEEIIEKIESHNWDINIRFPEDDKNLLDEAAYCNNVELLTYLIDKGGDFSKSLFECVYKGFYRPESIKLLVSKGASINAMGAWNVTPLCHVIRSYVRAIKQYEEYKEVGSDRAEKAKEEMDKFKTKIEFYISLGADPTRLDKEGNDYRAIIKKRWRADFLKKHNIVSRVRGLVFPGWTGMWKR